MVGNIQSALGCCWYFTFCRKNVAAAAADWYSQQQNDEDYFIMRQKRIAYVHFSLSHQHLSQFYAKFFCKNFCRVLWWRKGGGSPRVHCVYMFVRIWWFLGLIKVSDLSLFLKFWLNFSFWNLWHEISQKSRACAWKILLCYPQNLLKS